MYALRDINLRIQSGERLGIIGLNGAGKSTLLKVISRLLTPSSGKITIQGMVQPLIELGAGFNYEFSGRENIYLNGAMLGFSKKSIQEKEQQIISFTELGQYIDVPVKYYSTGMLMRLAFTIATQVSPEILLLDEMLSAGDIEFIQKAKDRIDRLLNVAKIVIIVSHDLGLIQSLATRAILLDKGNILFDGDTKSAIELYYDRAGIHLDQRKANEIEESLKHDGLKDHLDQTKEENDVAIPGQAAGPKQILVLDVSRVTSTISKEKINPGDTISFSMKFQTTVLVDKLFINLVITDRMGIWVAHLRNDAFEFHLDMFEPGVYELTLPIKNIPFKSGKYQYYFRLVSTLSSGNILEICDSITQTFEIDGNKKEHTPLNCQWVLEKNGDDH